MISHHDQVSKCSYVHSYGDGVFSCVECANVRYATTRPCTSVQYHAHLMPYHADECFGGEMECTFWLGGQQTDCSGRERARRKEVRERREDISFHFFALCSHKDANPSVTEEMRYRSTSNTVPCFVFSPSACSNPVSPCVHNRSIVANFSSTVNRKEDLRVAYAENSDRFLKYVKDSVRSVQQSSFGTSLKTVEKYDIFLCFSVSARHIQMTHHTR